MSRPKRSKGGKLRLKPCDRCHTPVSVRYRIKYIEDGDWTLVCPSCWHQVQPDNPFYRYGGTWKARRR